MVNCGIGTGNSRLHEHVSELLDAYNSRGAGRFRGKRNQSVRLCASPSLRVEARPPEDMDRFIRIGVVGLSAAASAVGGQFGLNRLLED